MVQAVDSFAAKPLTHTPAPHKYPTKVDPEAAKLVTARDEVKAVWKAPSTEVVRTDVKLPEHCGEKIAYTLDGLFTEEECKALIQLSEANGYEQAMVNVDGDKQRFIPEVRNNYRTMINDPVVAEMIYDRIKSNLPAEFHKSFPVGINEQMRYLRYDAEQKFEAHHDGSYERADGDKSLLTFQLYLNENFSEGSTRFLEEDEVSGVDVFPKTGRVLLFDHYLLHKGSPPVGGRKYAIRTDVMYRAMTQ
eukprot:GFYU01000399.1.p1 GENE.GFYU01000399.1~~GFYU01000399.1.p1  ORF type:complete len:248 (+),score=105.86 GFYU01000399.1:72-815(+)